MYLAQRRKIANAFSGSVYEIRKKKVRTIGLVV